MHGENQKLLFTMFGIEGDRTMVFRQGVFQGICLQWQIMLNINTSGNPIEIRIGCFW